MRRVGEQFEHPFGGAPTTTPGKDLASATPNPAPKGSSPFLKEIYRQFPPPKPSPQVKGSGKAIKKGEATCKGKSPLEVKEQFIGESHLLAEQKKMVDQLPHYDRKPARTRASSPASWRPWSTKAAWATRSWRPTASRDASTPWPPAWSAKTLRRSSAGSRRAPG